jgi:hypothetical protein
MKAGVGTLGSFAVEHEPYHDAALGGIGERLRELSRHGPRPIHVRREVNGRLALADRGEHRRKNLVAVLEHLDLVAVDHALASGSVERPEKCVELGPDQRYAHHPILVTRYGVRSERDIGERHHEGADDSAEQKEKVCH